MTSHDQLSKSLLKTFFADFLRLIDPDSSSRLRAEEASFLDKEDFTDWPAGDRREMDLLAEVPVDGEERPLLVHVEIETEFRSGMDRRIWQYYMMLRLRHELDVFPVLLNLRGGPPGIRPGILREGFSGKMTAIFFYRQLGLSGCQAQEWLPRPEPIAWAFAALMRPGDWSRAELKLECLRRIARSDVTGLRKQILADWVETYVQLTEAPGASPCATARQTPNCQWLRSGCSNVPNAARTFLGHSSRPQLDSIASCDELNPARVARAAGSSIDQRVGLLAAGFTQGRLGCVA